jgi:hypothetical protein
MLKSFKKSERESTGGGAPPRREPGVPAGACAAGAASLVRLDAPRLP